MANFTFPRRNPGVWSWEETQSVPGSSAQHIWHVPDKVNQILYPCGHIIQPRTAAPEAQFLEYFWNCCGRVMSSAGFAERRNWKEFWWSTRHVTHFERAWLRKQLPQRREVQHWGMKKDQVLVLLIESLDAAQPDLWTLQLHKPMKPFPFLPPSAAICYLSICLSVYLSAHLSLISIFIICLSLLFFLCLFISFSVIKTVWIGFCSIE